MLTPAEIWPMIAGSALVVFGAGQLVEKIWVSRFVDKNMCAEKHKREDERWERIDRNLQNIWKHIDGKHQSGAEQ